MSDPPHDPLAIPYDSLSAEALRGVIEAFVLREGTDYGSHEFTLDDKVAHVMRQLEQAEAEVVFEPTSGSVGIVRKSVPSRKRGLN